MRAAHTFGWILLGVIAVLLSAFQAPAAPFEPGLTFTLPAHPGRSRTAPLVATATDVEVNGIVARGLTRQTFVNTDSFWVEGIYVFPLPDEAAIDRLLIRVGDRLIKGEVKERSDAARTYAAARQAGQRASLLDQDRPNLFRLSVANIPPGAEIEVEIGWQQRLKPDAGWFALSLPIVVAPRYVPGDAGLVSLAPAGDARAVPDAGRIVTAYRRAKDGKGQPVSFSVSIDTGTLLEGLESASHAVAVTRQATRYRVVLKDGGVPSDRDFRLRWRPVADAGAAPSLYVEHVGQESFLLGMLTPPAAKTTGPADRRPREIIFVIDRSGSMHGTSIDQAKAALLFALGRLNPADTFNVIAFDDQTASLFRAPLPADPETVSFARGFVAGLEADGGTEMAPALQLALNGGTDPDRLRQVVFLTDGAVGNEEGLFGIVERDLGDVRLFTIGLGSAPNGWFMRKAAELGRGTYVAIDDLGAVEEEMRRLFARLEQPVLTGVGVDIAGEPAAEIFPPVVPDLYAGEPVAFVARLTASGGTVTLEADGGWRRSFDLAEAKPAAGIAKLWARAKIEALNDSARRGADPDRIKSAVVSLALRHGLASRHTSFVAVDTEPARPAAAPLATTEVPLNLPAGWSEEKVLGDAPGAPVPAMFTPIAGPQTATPFLVHAATAAAFAGLALVVLAIARRRAPA